VLGNGALLATLSAHARVEGLFWPNVDRGSHLGELRLGIERDGKLHWLDEEVQTQQSYLQDTNVLLTRLGDVELVDLVHELEPVLIRRVSGQGRLVVQCRPDLDGSTRLIGASVEGNRVVFYRRDVALAIGALGAEAFSHGFGSAEGGIALPFEGHAVVALAFGASSREAVARLDAALQQDFTDLLASRRRHDAARLDSAAPPPASAPEGLVSLYRRTLLVFDLLSDRRTGAVIAAPELDADFEHSGGYGFVWGRDLAFIVLAFLAAGRTDLAGRALRWLPGAQEPEGLWLQRHWTDGSLAPSWCKHQLDETGAILFAYEAAWEKLHDERLDAELWPSARRAAEFLLGTIEADGIPCATADLWGDFHGRYLRSIGDPVLDVSLLGLAWPFAAVDPAGERMRATVAALEEELGDVEHGLARYAGDTYAGGNDWVLAALWLGLWCRQVGDTAGLEQSLEYAVRSQTALGLLPEQVTDEGEPAWVVPLAWSHAMLLLAARPELDAISAGLGETRAAVALDGG